MRLTIDNVKTSLGVEESYDIVNAIRNSSSDNFQRYVPLADAENVAEVGAGILMTQPIMNEFMNQLIDRIGLVVLKSVQLQNPLKNFKKGMMPLGRTIEEIFTDIAHSKQYDPEDAEDTVFRREMPDVHTLFHERNRQEYYKQTVQDDSLKSAFTSWGNFESFISQILNAIYNGAEVDEYKYMMLLMDNYYAKGMFKVEEVDEPKDKESGEDFVKKLRATARKMTLPMGTRDYNAMAVHTKSDMADLHLFITPDLEAQLDVDVLAKAFNMDRANFLGNMTVIDGFSSDGIEAILVDKDFFMVYDTLQKMETIRNPQGLYWTYFYHVWQVLSASRFENAVAFVSEDVDNVQQVIVDPAVSSIKQGGEAKFKGVIRDTDGKDRDIEWDVEAMNDGDLEDDTKIDSDGKLSVDDDQEGQLKVTATVKEDTDDDDSDEVTGEAVVRVRKK